MSSGSNAAAARARHLGVDALAAGEELLQSDDRHRGRPLGTPVRTFVAEQEHLRQRAELLARQHGRVVEAEEAADRHQQGVAPALRRM